MSNNTAISSKNATAPMVLEITTVSHSELTLGVRGGVVDELMVGVVAIGGVVSELTIGAWSGGSVTISAKKCIKIFSI